MTSKLRLSIVTLIIGFGIPTIGSVVQPVRGEDQPLEIIVEAPPTEAPAPEQAAAEQPVVEVPASEPTPAAPIEQPVEVPAVEPTAVLVEQPAEPTPIVDPTEQEPVAEPTEELTPESTLEVTPEAVVTSVADETPMPEDPASSTGTPAPEVTIEPEATETLMPEETVEPEATETLMPEETIEPEATELPTLVAPLIETASACTETGVSFVIHNAGGSMEIASAYSLTMDGAANPQMTDVNVTGAEFMLLEGETLTLEGGYGQPELVVEGVSYRPEEPCMPSPLSVLTISALCTLEKGVVFTVANTGESMTVEQSYVISPGEGEPVSGAFLLGAEETVSLDGGYGQPVFTTDELISAVDTPCEAPTAISGIMWNDINEDMFRDETEPAMRGVSVNLIDATGTVRTIVTGDDGVYRFDMLPVGNYTIIVDTNTLPPDFILSFPSSSALTLDATGANNSADFGFKVKRTASVSGTVWLESSNYGVRDAGETGITGVIVELVNMEGVTLAISEVNPITGSYEFDQLPGGAYVVRLNQSTLFSPNGVTWNSDSAFDYETPVTLAADQLFTGIDFGLVGTY